MKTNIIACLAAITMAFTAFTSVKAQTILTRMPDEASAHEGTWLQWPHAYTYGTAYRNSLDATWVAMTRALVAGEKVHIIAYNAAESTRVKTLLTTAKVPQTNVTFLLRVTDDVWVRDNGPMFVFTPTNQLKIADWGFNGWGLDTPYSKDNPVPIAVATALALPCINLNTTILEGGAIEHDGQGVMLATRSSILEPKRNSGLTQSALEARLKTNLGFTKFIWLNGANGGKDDITDMHIDGFAKFGPNHTLFTMNSVDLTYWGLSAADITTLFAASDVNAVPYTRVLLPLTAGDVKTTNGRSLGYKGSYANFYVANTVVLVPTYNDPNDAAALRIIQASYTTRTVIGIDSRNLYGNGGMIHCVTQQQPR